MKTNKKTRYENAEEDRQKIDHQKAYKKTDKRERL